MRTEPLAQKIGDARPLSRLPAHQLAILVVRVPDGRSEVLIGDHSSAGSKREHAHVCGIVGLFLKDKALEPELGRLTAAMLHEMCGRGPDSAGFAVYGSRDRRRVEDLRCHVARRHSTGRMSRRASRARPAARSRCETIEDHAILRIEGDGATARTWLIENVPEATVLSEGEAIEIYKGVGDPDAISARLRLASFSGTHAIGHTRMATESAVTIAGSHPFSTGRDTCLVHNGSLSNHNRLRETLRRHGETIPDRERHRSRRRLSVVADARRATPSSRRSSTRSTISTASIPSSSARAMVSPCCAIPSPASRLSWLRRMTGSRSDRSSARWRRCPASMARASGSRRRRRSTPGAGAEHATGHGWNEDRRPRRATPGSTSPTCRCGRSMRRCRRPRPAISSITHPRGAHALARWSR